MSYLNPTVGKFFMPDGSGKYVGIATLVTGGATVINSNITNNTRIFLTPEDGTLNIGHVWVDSRSAGNSFHISSNNVLDTRIIAWLLIEPT